jgi:hypothetical protein
VIWAVVGLADVYIVAAGGVISAAIAGIATVGGVLINANSQTKPERAEIDESEMGSLRAELLEVKMDRDRWRDLAMEWMPRRRSGDPQPDDTEGHHLPD